MLVLITPAGFFFFVCVCESMTEATAGEEEDPPTDLITASTESDLDLEKCKTEWVQLCAP